MADAALVRVPITKAKDFIEIDTSAIPAEAWAEIVLQGLKVVLNRGTSKITKETYPDAEELKTKAAEVAKEQLELVMSNKIKTTGAKTKATKESGKVMTFARNLARTIVRDAIKANGGKVSHYEPKDITAAANQMLKDDPSIIEQAKAQMAALEATPSHTVDILSLIKPSDKKVKQANEAAAKKSKGLSAAQAGKAKPRAKPGATA